MVKSVYVPEAGGMVNFADDVTPQEMSRYLDAKYPRAAAAPPAATPDESGVLGRFAYGLATGITDIPGGIAALGLPAEKAAKSDAGQFSESARKYLQGTLGIDPTKEATTSQMLAQGLGSAAGFLIPGGAVAKGASLLGRGAALAGEAALASEGAALAGRAGAITAAGQGAALGASQRAQTIQQQLASGMNISDEDQLASQQLSGLFGLSQALPMQKFFGPLNVLLSKVPASKAPIVERIIKSRIAKLAKAGTEEAAQEAAEGIANDLMEYGVYNPDVQIGQDLLSNAAGGAFAGSVIEGVIQLAAGRKLRGARQLQADLQAEGQKNISDKRQAYVADAADKLRATGVEGTLTIEQNESPDGRPRFTVMSPKGEPLVDLFHPDDAVSAVNMYKQNTGANVSVDLKEVPQLDAVRIGRTKFANIEAAVKKREEIRKHITTLEQYAANPEMIKEQAAIQNVTPDQLGIQIAKTLERHKANLKMFDRYFEPDTEEAAPEAAGVEVKPTAVAEPVAETVPPEAVTEAVTEPAIGQAAPTEVVTEPVIKAEDVSPELTDEDFAAAVNEPITSEEDVPEMPIGAVELPIEESRVLPDEDVDSVTGPIPAAEPVSVRTVKRPSANPEELMALREELFGSRLDYDKMTPEQLALYEAERDKRFPPQDVETYYASGRLNEPLPKNMREAVLTGPVVKDLTPESQAWIKKLYEGLYARLKPVIPEGAAIELKTLIDESPAYLIRGQARTLKEPNGIKTIIDLSTGVLKPDMTIEAAIEEMADVMNHEMIHALKNRSVFRPAEWRMLLRSVESAKVPGKSYTYLDKAEAIYTPLDANGIPQPISETYKNPEAVREEAIAEMYREWIKNRNMPPKEVTGLLNRITEFFRRIFQALRNARHEEIFQKIASGEIGAREARAVEVRENEAEAIDSAPKFSAAPLPQYVEEQNRTMFAPRPQISMPNRIFGYFFGPDTAAKVLKTATGEEIALGKGKMAAIAGKQAAVDSAAYLGELEKLLNKQRTGNYQRMNADESAIAAMTWRRRASHVFAAMGLRGNLKLNYATPGDIMSATMKVEDDPDSLKNIFNVMMQPGPIDPATGKPGDKTEIFRTYAVAKRGEWLRSTGQTVPRELTPEYIRQTMEFTRREYPEIIEAYNMYQRFNKKLMTTVRDAGLISTAELGRLTNQMNYYGFIYEAYGEPLGPTTSQKTASKFKLRPYTGSQHGGLVNDPMFVMIQNAQFMVESVAKNLASMKAFNVANLMGEARLLGTNEAPKEYEGEAPDVMFFSKNGEVKRFAVKDPLLVQTLGSDDRINVGKFWETLGLPAHVLRESVTRDPGFMARNLLRDTLSSWITSGVDFTPVVGTLKGFVTALKDGTSFKALQARGVVGSYDMAMQTPAELAATFRKNNPNVQFVADVEGAQAAVRSLWNRLGSISEASDAATRIAVYDACIKQGMSEAEAAMQSIELLDFTRRGASQTLGILTKLIPFLNARIQGMDVLYQASRAGIRYATGRSLGERDANIGKKFLVRGGMLAAIAVALEMMNSDDEDYKNLDEYIKTGNFIVPLKEFGLPGQFMAIPKPFEAGLLFATIPQQIYKTTRGDASMRENAELFWGQLASTFGVNPIPQALLPGIEIITNHNFYTGLPLISEGKLRLSPELQYNTSTSQLAMMIGGLPIFYDFTTGRFGGASPIVIDKLISGYGGPVGSYMSMGVSLAMQAFEVGPERMPIELANAPVVRSFFIDAKSKNPKVVTQAYELFQIADEANRTMSRLKQMGDVEALTEYVEKNRTVLNYKKYIFKLAENLNKISAQERAIERDTKMTPDEKIAAARQLREVQIRLASQVDTINKTLGR